MSQSDTVEETPTPKFLIDELNKIAKAEEFIDFNIETRPGANHGDGFMSFMLAATISGKKKVNGIITGCKLTVVCKMPPENEARREMFQGIAAFEREVYLYGTVLPSFVQYQRDKGITSRDEGFFSFPKIYSIRNDPEANEYVIIMEDLRPKKFKMWNKYKPVNFDHVKLMVTELGKYHAMSMGMKIENPEHFEEYKNLKDIMVKMFDPAILPQGMPNMAEVQFKRAIDALDECEEVARSKMQHFCDNMLPIMQTCVNGDDAEPFAVIGHGDCWNNNMLFHYNESDVPDKISFLDWQISRYCSPVIDLVYFLFTGSNKEFRDKHYDEILGIYHNSLVNMLKRLDIPNYETVFTLSDLYNQLHKFGIFGLAMSTMLVPMIVVDPQFLPDMNKMAEQMQSGHAGDMDMMFHESIREIYKERISDIIRDCIRYGYL